MTLLSCCCDRLNLMELFAKTPTIWRDVVSLQIDGTMYASITSIGGEMKGSALLTNDVIPDTRLQQNEKTAREWI